MRIVSWLLVHLALIYGIFHWTVDNFASNRRCKSGYLQVYERTKELKVKGGHAGLAGSVNKRRIASITQIYRCISLMLTPNPKYLLQPIDLRNQNFHDFKSEL